jgi:hypothetical protein
MSRGATHLKFQSNLLVRGLALIPLMGLTLAAPLPAGAQATTKPLTPSQMVSPKLLVTRIDTNCAVFKSAIKTQKPTDVIALKTSLWRLASDSDVVAAKKTHSAYTLAEVWKQAGNYNWIHSYTAGSGGAHHATQLCFRNDGTLARVKQATTVPALDASSARSAYYNTDGSLIQKTAMFEIGDPAIAKRVKDLPYFKLLP